MKNKKIIKIVLISLAIIILIAGVVVTAMKGFNFDVKYDKSTRIEIQIGSTFNINDIKNITNEIFPNERVMLQKVELYEDRLVITVKEASDEQLENLTTKINEKYTLELTKDNLYISNNPHVKLYDILKKYIAPFIIISVIILVYMAVRYYKLNSLKVLFQTILTMLLPEALYFSLVSITRFPVSDILIPIGIVIYVISITVLAFNYENKLEKIALENKKKK